MIYVPTYREQLLKHLPSGMRCLEIGVQKGNFSDFLINRLKPDELTLIDPWKYSIDGEYSSDAANVSQSDQDSIYFSVLERFKEPVASGVVKIVRDSSPSAAENFSDKYFDFIYIDGMHYMDAVYNDLVAWAPKLKAGGILAGHDFSNHTLAKSMNFGVVDAVLKLVNSRTKCNTVQRFMKHLVRRPESQSFSWSEV